MQQKQLKIFWNIFKWLFYHGQHLTHFLVLQSLGLVGFFFCQNLNTYSFRGDYDFTVKNGLETSWSKTAHISLKTCYQRLAVRDE